MKGYAGSVAFSGSGDQVAITCPKGGVLALFGSDGQFLEMVARQDICGVGPTTGGFIATDGLGGVVSVGAEGLRPVGAFDRAWDNHLVAI